MQRGTSRLQHRRIAMQVDSEPEGAGLMYSRGRGGDGGSVSGGRK